MAYIATNIDTGFISHLLAFKNIGELETMLTGLGKNLSFSFLCGRL